MRYSRALIGRALELCIRCMIVPIECLLGCFRPRPRVYYFSQTKLRHIETKQTWQIVLTLVVFARRALVIRKI